MLIKWKLFNFKSVRNETELDMAPLTIFAGANSSGKSSFLQSILLVAQTLAHKVNSRSVVLNGSMTRLGQFDDLKSIDSDADQIVIGWTYNPSQQRPENFGIDFLTSPYFLFRGRELLSSVKCEIAFDAKDSQVPREITQIQPLLFNTQLSVTTTSPDSGDQNYSLNIYRSQDIDSIKRKWLNTADENEPVPQYDDLFDDESLPQFSTGIKTYEMLQYDVSLDNESLADLREEIVSGEAVGCSLRHFLPERIALGVDMVSEDTQAIINVLTGERPHGMSHRYFSSRNIPVPQKVVDRILEEAEYIDKKIERKILPRLETFLDQIPNLFGPQAVLLGSLHSALRKLHPRDRREVYRQLSENDEFEKLVRESSRAERPKQLKVIRYRPPHAIGAASWYTDQFFSSSVKYLGPLRDEPKSLYPLSPTTDPSDIGLKGEHTAAVLELHKNRSVKYIPTSAFADTEINSQSITRPLVAAVVDWLQYLGVADDVESKDKGKLGHELTVQIAGTNRSHDLTHVGVGVSQVLPILVVSLLSDAGTTLIFEQPELHLHPKVQTLLADFFLSITQLGKQCVIETHSEYFINRIRFRVAAAVNQNPWVEAVKMYFVDRDEQGSSFHLVNINEYGAILDWPEGFFDQSQRETEAILRAALLKRRAKRKN